MSVEVVRNHTAVRELAENLSLLCHLLSSEAEATGLRDTVEHALLVAEELQTLVDLLHADSKASLEVIAAFSAKCENMEQLFSQIDTADQFVNNVRAALQAAEAAVATAEVELQKRR